MDIRLYDGSSLHTLPATIPSNTSVRVHVWGVIYSTYTYKMVLQAEWWIHDPDGIIIQDYIYKVYTNPGEVFEFIGPWFLPTKGGDYQISVRLRLIFYDQVMGEESWEGVLLTAPGAAPTEPEFGDFGIQDYSRT